MIMSMTLETPSLMQLLAGTAAGDHACFAQIYQRTHVYLFGVALRMLGNHSVAEDVLQESFVNVWRGAASYKNEQAGHDGVAMAWLTSIVRNRALDVLRNQLRRKEEPLPDLGIQGDAELQFQFSGDQSRSALEVFDEAAQKLKIDQCLAALDGSHRQSLALAYYQGYSSSEVAAQMGAPLGSVKSWIRRGLNKLRDCLADQAAPVQRT